VYNIEVNPNEECVPKHKLLVVDMQYKTTKRCHKKFEVKSVCILAQGVKDVRNTSAWSGIR